MTHDFQLEGIITADPTGFGQAKSASIDLVFNHAYGKMVSGVVDITSTDLAPYTVNLDGITSVNLLAVRILSSSASVKVKVTSAVGTDQTVSVSGLYVWHSPVAGDVLTAIKLVGTAQLEYLVAGS